MKNILLYTTLLGFLWSCDEDQVAMHDTGDTTPPENVSEVTVESTAGGAIVSYSLPDDGDVLMVKAEYEIANGATKEFTSSYYKDELTLEGFGDTDEKSFRIYSVDRSGNESSKEEHKFHPLTPPVTMIYESLLAQADFGGVHINWLNENNAEISIITMAQDSLGELNEVDVLYTSVKDGDYSVRGFNSEERLFAFLVRDRWDNYSDTLFVTLTPWFEEELDRTIFKQMILPGEANLANWGGHFSQMIDGITVNANNYGHTQGNPSLPVVVTVDLGVKAKLSRFRHWQRWGWYYRHHNPRQWELWGSNDPNPDGSDDGWTKLGSYKSFKPSGLPVGQLSNEDVEYASAGEESVIPLDAPAVRYLRFKMTESWAGGNDFMMAELTAFGQIEE